MFTIHPCTQVNKSLSFNITVIEGGVPLHFVATLTLELRLETEKLDKKVPSGAKLIPSQDDRSDTYTTKRKALGSPLINKLPQSDAGNQATVHPKRTWKLIHRLPHLFRQIPYNIELDPSVTPRNTPHRPVPILQQTSVGRHASSLYHKFSLPCHPMDQTLCHSQ